MTKVRDGQTRSWAVAGQEGPGLSRPKPARCEAILNIEQLSLDLA